MPVGKIVKIGAWEEGKFIGVLLYSYGANNNAAKSFGLTQYECCELTRIALTRHKSPVSRLIKISLLMLKQKCPGLRLVFSYSDKSNQNHHGGIYQAANWKFLGARSTSDKGAYYIIHGKKMHGRSARAKYGHESKFPVGWRHSPSETKYLYVKVVDPDYKLQMPEQKYPKRAVSKENVVPGVQLGEGGANPTTALHNFTGTQG